MGLRTFTDAEGTCWRAWRVMTPSANAHLVDASFRDGWLVFEREDGEERRRLMQAPEDWASFSDARLVVMLQAATRVEPTRLGITGSIPLVPPPDRDR